MSDKARLFRSLLLEPLECRSVFSVDSYDVWQFSDPNFEFDHSQPAQYPTSEFSNSDASLRGPDNGFNGRNLNNVYFDRPVEYTNVIYIEIRAPRGQPMHHGRYEELDNLPLREPESEGPSTDSRPAVIDSTPVQTPSTQTPSGQNLATQNSTTPSLGAQASGSQSTNLQFQLLANQLSSQNQGSKFTGANNSPSAPSQFRESPVPGFGRLDVAASNNSANNIHPSANAQNSGAGTFTGPLNGLANGSANSAASQSSLVNPTLASLSSTSLSAASGTTTFDLSLRPRSSDMHSASGSVGQSIEDFRFSKPMMDPAESIFDQALLERAAGIESLDNLLSGLAENYRHGRAHNGFDADQPNARNNQNLRSESSVAVEAAFSDGGMIALALNRDIAFKELEEISDSALTENKAWIANVGIFRAFENGAVAVTEYASLTNRVTRGSEASPTSVELTDVESEVANSQFQPLWASTSAVLGAVMIGLRRIRKSNPLMFTSRGRSNKV